MTPKERVLKAIRHEETDRVPVYVTVTPQIGDALNERFGLPKVYSTDPLINSRITYTEVLNILGNDCVGVGAGNPKDFNPELDNDGCWVNEWGIKIKNCGFYDEMVEHPLANVEDVADLDKFTFPDPDAEGRYDLAEKMIKQYSRDYAVAGGAGLVFELSWYLVGLEKFMIDLTSGKKYVFELMDRLLEITTKGGCSLIERGVDLLWTGDDFGNQNGMMISPTLWRKEFKPRFARVFNTYKKLNPDIKIIYHSCGSILPIIPDLIEIGINILNPIQPAAAGMDPKFLKERYGKDLVFCGGIDVQHLLPKETPKEIKKSVKETISILGKGGGYILAPAHNIQPDTPIENILAMYEAVRDNL
jgi:uroporphyrinogen decarboxylase